MHCVFKKETQVIVVSSIFSKPILKLRAFSRLHLPLYLMPWFNIWGKQISTWNIYWKTLGWEMGTSVNNGNRTDWVQFNSVCNHTSDNKIGRPCSGSRICLSRVWLQTELDDTKSYYQLIRKIAISEERRPKLWKKGKICIKRLKKEAQIVWCRHCLI